MNLYHVCRIQGGSYNELEGCVVRAVNEKQARILAAIAEDELQNPHIGDNGTAEGSAFLDATLTTCLMLTQDGPSGVICSDFYEP